MTKNRTCDLIASYRELKDISLKQKKKTDKQAKNRMKMKTKNHTK